MRIDSIKANKNLNFKGVLNNKLLVKTIEKASDNGVLFCAGTSVVLSTLIRPLAIMATPNVEKENKQYACAKSIASSIIGLVVTALISIPIVLAIANIERNPKKFLTPKTIKTFKNNVGTLAQASSFKFVSLVLSLGSGLLTVIPKTFLACALISPVMTIVFPKKVNSKDIKKQNISKYNKQLTFKGLSNKPHISNKFTDKLSRLFAKVFNNEKMQKFADKFHDTSLAQHMFSLSDIFATGLFIHFTNKNRNIEENRKRTLVYNSAIATGITIIGGYLTNWLLKKPTERFIKAFEKANPNLAALPKYEAGIKNIKAAFILGGMYYIITPIIATISAEFLTNKK